MQSRLHTRRCVGCGYDGALLRGGQAERCARCGCDLAKRPPRSYAEMEGLVGQPVILDAPLTPDRRQERVLQRWIAFLFLAALFIILLCSLSIAALSV